MGIRCLVLGVTLLLCVGAQDERPRSVSPPPREAAWSASAAATDALVRWVAGQLRSHRIARLEIVWVPGDIGTLIPLTPQALEEHPV